MKEISVIIPNLNSTVIGQTIASLKAQAGFTGDDMEILVVGLDEPGHVREDGMVRFINTVQPVYPAAARNLGMREAQGRYFVFIDADCVAGPNWLEKLMTRLRDGEKVVSGAVTFDVKDYWTLCDNLSLFHEFLPGTEGGTRPYLPTTNLALSKEVSKAVGDLDETLPRGEDLDWTIRMSRLGYRLCFEPAAVVCHLASSGRNSFAQVWRRGVQSGKNMIKVRARYPQTFDSPSFAQSAWWLTVLSPLIAAFTALRILLSNRDLLRYLHTLPVLFCIKLAWCLGAAQQIRRDGRTKPAGRKLRA